VTSTFNGSTEETERLAQALRRIPRVIAAAERSSRAADAEAWQIATALSDIRESTHRLFSDLVPRLLEASPTDEVADDLLNEIGEEYRHILYHILDTKLFDYIVPRE
jgi:glucose-6-phosphate-specific signal transduction histidine kinase